MTETPIELDASPNRVSSRASHSIAMALFAATIFWGAFLLFQVQPIMGKFILPWFGGSPGVWTTCMLVFQLLLFAGYSYAHLMQRYLGLRNQAIVHTLLLALSLFLLPITPDSSWKPQPEDSPTLLIMVLLLSKVGAPYFLLSTTGPLLQNWLSQSQLVDKPYRLYALSNVGSILALLSFPFVFEPMLSSPEQSVLWTIGFVFYAVLCSLVGIFMTRTQSAFLRVYSPQAEDMVDAVDTSTSRSRDNSTIFYWFACSALPSILLLATTNQVCLDTAVIPFLWVVPLAIYLLSFILTFDSDRWYSRRPCIQLAVLSFLGIYATKLVELKLPLAIELALYFSGLFFACMVAHGELVASRPDARRLTLFYMTISAGGACGGLFVGLVAPNLFSGFYEFQLGLLGCMMLFFATYLRSNPWWSKAVPPWSKLTLAIGIPVVATVWLSFWNAHSNQQLFATRNFYGVLSVTDGVQEKTGEPIRQLVHGRVVHGSQFSSNDKQHLPTTYYTPTSGVGQVLESIAGENRRVGIVGLGAGTLATYGTAGDTFRFYEINPQVIALAQSHFTFLSSSAANCEMVLGDARLQLEREPDQQFDLLVLDAFSGDAIPVHLLTHEAMNVYQRHLSPRGVMAVHISNLYFDLQSVVRGIATSQKMDTLVLSGAEEASPGAFESTWAILSRDSEWLEELAVSRPPNSYTFWYADPNHKGQREHAHASPESVSRLILWTDERSNLFEVLK